MWIFSSLTSRRPISPVSEPGHFKRCLPHLIAPSPHGSSALLLQSPIGYANEPLDSGLATRLNNFATNRYEEYCGITPHIFPVPLTNKRSADRISPSDYTTFPHG